MSYLEFKNVKLIKEQKEILKRVDFAIEKGEIYAVVGKNGAGKSTIAYTLMGISGYTDISGDILLDGEKINNLSVSERAQKGITLLWQEPVRFDGITVREYMKKTLKKDDEALFKEALTLVNLDYKKYIDRFVDESLSGGERKRVELAVIYLMSPKVLVLDEPDSGIDIEAIHYIFNMLEILKKKGTTILIITHSDEVLKKADRGVLICCGSTYMESEIGELEKYFGSKCPTCEVDYNEILNPVENIEKEMEAEENGTDICK